MLQFGDKALKHESRTQIYTSERMINICKVHKHYTQDVKIPTKPPHTHPKLKVECC